MHYQQLLAALTLAGAAQASLYSKSSSVLQVDASNYNKLITKSNHTSVSYTMSISFSLDCSFV